MVKYGRLTRGLSNTQYESSFNSTIPTSSPPYIFLPRVASRPRLSRAAELKAPIQFFLNIFHRHHDVLHFDLGRCSRLVSHNIYGIAEHQYPDVQEQHGCSVAQAGSACYGRGLGNAMKRTRGQRSQLAMGNHSRGFLVCTGDGPSPLNLFIF